MTKSSFNILVIIAALIVQPLFLFGQTSDEWSAVKALPAGTNIRVERHKSGSIEGTLKSVSDSEIAVMVKAVSQTVAMGDVKAIYKLEPGSRGKWAAIGGAVGAGIGAAIAFAALGATGGSDNTAGVAAPIIAAGAAIGAGLGAGFPMKKRTLIFRSK